MVTTLEKKASGKKRNTTDIAFLPYGRQHVTQEDIDAVVQTLQSDFLTQGPAIQQFETALCQSLKAKEAIACSNGTAALHLAMMALDVGVGDIVLTTPNTFLADANCARYVGADVQFADIDPATGNIDLNEVENVLKKDLKQKIKVVIPVHFAGQPVDLQALRQITERHGVRIVDDACHALGSSIVANGEVVSIGENRWSDMTVYSFHPVKHVATGEGGAITTASAQLAERLRRLRSHGMNRDQFENKQLAYDSTGCTNPWYYEMSEFGFNYRLTDIQAALGTSQLQRLPGSVRRRNEIASRYRTLLNKHVDSKLVRPLAIREDVTHAYHLFVIQIDFKALQVSRAVVMNKLKERNIGTQVHYIPIHLQPYYCRYLGNAANDLRHAEAYYERALSLPMYPDITDDQVDYIIETLASVLGIS